MPFPFNRLVDAAGSRRIRLHDVRHTYSTLSQMSRIASGASFDKIRKLLLAIQTGSRSVSDASSHAS